MCEYCEQGQELLGSYVCGDRAYVGLSIADGNLLRLMEAADTEEYESGNSFEQDWMRINFCPVCGRDLLG